MLKRLVLIAAVMLVTAPLFAQNQFSDVPKDHWAYSAVNELKGSGILSGYDGNVFNGQRTLTRYEFAMVIAKLLPFLESEDLDLSSFATKGDLNGYLKTSDYKKADTSNLVSKSDLEIILKLSKEFQAELSSLGVDVNTLNSDVSALKSRITALEDESARIKISGSANFIANNAINIKGDTDGLLYNIDRNTNQENVQNMTFKKDFQIDVVGRVSNDINAYLSLVAGDYLRREESGATQPTDVNTSDTSIVPYYAYVSMDLKKYGNFRTGRLPFQINPYVFKRVDWDSYTDIPRMEAGDYSVEGADYAFSVKGIDTRLWFVKPEKDIFYDPTLNYIGYYAQKSYGLTNDIKAMYGGELAYNVLGGKISGSFTQAEAYTYLDENQRTNIYGASLILPVKKINLTANWYAQDTKATDVTAVKGVDKPTVFDVGASYDSSKLSLAAGYREAEAGYAAPGNWEVMAYVINPDNIKGWFSTANYNFNDKLSVYGTYKDYSGLDQSIFTRDTLSYWNAATKYNFGKFGSIELKYEDLNNDNDKSTYSTATWVKEAGNAKFKIAYQYVNNKNLFNENIKNTGSIIWAQTGIQF